MSRFVAVLAGALLVAAPASHATFLGHNGKIAFDRHDGIWVMDPDGSDQAQLIGAGQDPAWSPDGRSIAYGCEAGSRICVAQADGTLDRVLERTLPSPRRPAWSPDGVRLAVDTAAFCGPRVCVGDLFRIDAADGNDPILLEGFARDGNWSVNGLVAFNFHGTNPTPGIWVVDPRRPNAPTKVPNTDGGISPDWSPDGTRLVFARPQAAGVPHNIYVVNRDGSNLAQVTTDPGYDLEPIWSPDGTKIAFIRRPAEGGNQDVWVVNIPNGAQTQLTNTPEVHERGLAWQPAPQPTYVRPQRASPLQVSLVPAFERCFEPNRSHGPPLSFGSCAPPDPRPGFMTFGVDQSQSGTPPGAVGHVRLAVVNGAPDLANQADVKVSVTLSDLRRQSDYADGPGSLELVLPVRITDMTNGPFDSEHQATVRDLNDAQANPLRVLLPCAETADPAVGSTCTATTTVNAVSPGAVRERSRAIWELDQLAVQDGGEDGFIETRTDNTVVAVQGVFVP